MTPHFPSRPFLPLTYSLPPFPFLSSPYLPQILLSHTPMRSLLPQYKDKQILALGSKDYATVCRAYGFENVVTVEDVLHAHPELYPFKTYHKRHDLHKDPFSGTFGLVVDVVCVCGIRFV